MVKVVGAPFADHAIGITLLSNATVRFAREDYFIADPSVKKLVSPSLITAEPLLASRVKQTMNAIVVSLKTPGNNTRKKLKRRNRCRIDVSSSASDIGSLADFDDGTTVWHNNVSTGFAYSPADLHQRSFLTNDNIPEAKIAFDIRA